MASKKLKNLAALAAAAAAGYGASKMFGSKAPAKASTKKSTGLSQSINIARQEGKEAEYNQMSPRGTGFEQRTSENMQMEPYGEKVASKGAPTVPVAQPSSDDMMAGFGPMAKKGKFITKKKKAKDMSKEHEGMESKSEEDKEYAMEEKGYKETSSGKMTKMVKGGSVLARGNKFARTRPTKLY
jgi:hypothetical protein